MPILTGKPQLNRRVNRTLILDRIRSNGEISRAQLAKITDIRPPTVSAIIRELIDEGLVIETGLGKPHGGRAPRMVALSCEQPQTLGFEITETSILAGLCDLKGNLRAADRIPFAPAAPEQTVERLARLGQALLASPAASGNGKPLEWTQLQGVGVAVPGLIDYERRLVRWSRPLGWRDVPLAELCQSRWKTPTDVVNDSAAGSMAAHFFATDGVENLVYAVLRFDDASHGVVGIGTALIVHGEPYHGEFGAAGEITTPVAHPLTDARDHSGRPFADSTALVAALHEGQDSAVAAVERVSRELSLLLLHAVNLLQPGRLIIESDVPELGKPVGDCLQRILDEHALGDEPGRTEIVVSQLGDYGGVRGAVVPTLKRVFKLPRWE